MGRTLVGKLGINVLRLNNNRGETNMKYELSYDQYIALTQSYHSGLWEELPVKRIQTNNMIFRYKFSKILIEFDVTPTSVDTKVSVKGFDVDLPDIANLYDENVRERTNPSVYVDEVIETLLGG